jgi:diguanylate cyclase (GGDEF)-like protein
VSSNRAEARSGDSGLDAAALLRAEVARLTCELEEARAKITELEQRADVDPMLDILNRRGFDRELTRSLAYVKRYDTPAALLYIDLDGFKTVNDRYGHAAGDELLKLVAAELAANVRASDLVGRLGGDEFGVLMWNAAKPQAMMRARDLENRIEGIALARRGEKFSVGASVGVAVLCGDLTPAALMDLADKAMYARKNERRA